MSQTMSKAIKHSIKTYLPTLNQIAYWGWSKIGVNALISQGIELSGGEDNTRIELACQKLMEKWEILRTIYELDETGLVHCHVLPADLDMFKVRYVSTDDIEKEHKKAFEFNENIPLTEGPLITFYVFNDGKSRFFKLYVNHIHCGGLGTNIMMTDLIGFYINPNKPLLHQLYQNDEYAEYENARLLRNYEKRKAFARTNYTFRNKKPFFNETPTKFDTSSMANLLRQLCTLKESPKPQDHLSDTAWVYRMCFNVGDIATIDRKLGSLKITALSIFVAVYNNLLTKFMNHLEMLIILLEGRGTKYNVNSIGDYLGETFYGLDGIHKEINTKFLQDETKKLLKRSENLIFNRDVFFADERREQEEYCGYINFSILPGEFHKNDEYGRFIESVGHRQSMALELYCSMYKDSGYVSTKWRFRSDKMDQDTILKMCDYFRSEVLRVIDLVYKRFEEEAKK